MKTFLQSAIDYEVLTKTHMDIIGIHADSVTDNDQFKMLNDYNGELEFLVLGERLTGIPVEQGIYILLFAAAILGEI